MFGPTYMSFENALKRKTNIHVESRDGQFRLVRAGKSSAWYADDAFGTGAANILAQLRSLHPDLSAFKHVPMVSVGGHVDIGRLLDSVDTESLEDFITRLPAAYDNCVADYRKANDDDSGLVKEVRECLSADALFNIFCMLRSECARGEPDWFGKGDKLPYIQESEFFAFFTGCRPGCFKHPKGAIPPSFLLTLVENYPEGEVEEETGDFVIYGKDDPFRIIGGKKEIPTLAALLVEVEQQAGVVEKKLAAPQPSTSMAAPSDDTSDSPLCDDSVTAGIDHVLTYKDMVLNKLSEPDRLKYLYGNPHGKVYFESLSKVKRGELAHLFPTDAMPDEGYEPGYCIRKLAVFMVKNRGREATALKLTEDEQWLVCCLVAAGRILAWSSSWCLEAKWKRAI
uniref:Uncharacterized protein n=1 Tax=Sina virus TaxID=2703872 RepID=A0A6G9L898_9VIRU|nr:MAG: hypothetical protein [Sina virus]